jgi:hypothetical protein
MRASAKSREEFLSVLQAEFPPERASEVLKAGRLLLRHACTHNRLMEEFCNGSPAQSFPHISAKEVGKLQQEWDDRIERQKESVRKRVVEICGELGIRPNFSGDPRGYTVKLHLPSGRYNTWGGQEEGWGVPS